MRFLTLLLALLLPLAAQAAEPGASAWAANEAGRVRLVAATTASAGESVRLGLHFELKPGWKIYWRTPGDAGYPPKIDWSKSSNLGIPAIQWPAPKRFVLAGLQNHGYEGEVVLPLDAPVLSPGNAIRAAAELDYLACATICVPMQASLNLDLPAGSGQPSAFVHQMGRFAALVPGDGARHGLRLQSVETSGSGDASLLVVRVESDQPLDAPDIFVEPAETASFDQPRVQLQNGGRLALIQVAVVPGTIQVPLAAGPLTLTVVDGLRSLQAVRVPVSAAPPSAAPSLLAMLGVALLGGLILNLMPCVLPVLSIKVVGAIGHGGAGRGHVRAAFLASAAGIVTSFLILAGTAIAVKAAGQAVGWGIQFQQPGFLAAMVVILALFAANLWGTFEIPLPGFLTTGGKAAPHHTLFGHFLSGAFATLLATPCSAPFLGTAVGFALARGPLEIVAIFTALGAGMAVPYLAVAAWPAAAQRLPRPGPWMIRLKQILGLALGGTALWLLTVLAAQAGLATALLTGGAMAAALALMAVRRRMPAHSRTATLVSALALAALAVGAPMGAEYRQAEAPAAGGAQWQAFDRARIPALLAEGKVVFVDVTADWCITCKVNKAAVLDRGEAGRRLAGPDIVAMRADWTRPDDAIAAYLASFGRYGIPFNAVYGPAAPEGIALSELLTESEVLTALDRAR